MLVRSLTISISLVVVVVVVVVVSVDYMQLLSWLIDDEMISSSFAFAIGLCGTGQFAACMAFLFTIAQHNRLLLFVLSAVTVFAMIVYAIVSRALFTLVVIWFVLDVVLIKVTKLGYRLCISLLLILTGIEFAVIDAFLAIVYILIMVVSWCVYTANVEHERQVLFFLYITLCSPFVALFKVIEFHRRLCHWLLALLQAIQLSLPDAVLLIVYIIVTVIILYRFVFIDNDHHEEARGRGGGKGRVGRSGDGVEVALEEEEKERRKTTRRKQQQLLQLQLQQQLQQLRQQQWRQQQQLQQLQQQQQQLILQQHQQQQQQQQQQGEPDREWMLSTKNDKSATLPTTDHYHDNDHSDVCDYDYSYQDYDNDNDDWIIVSRE